MGDYGRISAHDWRVLYRLLDSEVEYLLEMQHDEPRYDERRVKYLEVLRDAVAEEMAQAIGRDRSQRDAVAEDAEAPDPADPSEAEAE